MNQGGITTRIFNFANSVVGHLPGGLGQVNIVASIIFSGMSGSASADAAGLGSIELKAMSDAGYDKDFALAVTGASSLVGPIIPPSIPLVFYGVAAETSVGALLLAGIIPGLILGLSMMVYVAIYATLKNYPREKKQSVRDILKNLWYSLFPLFTPLIIITGIFSGWFTATEAAAVAATYALILSFIYGDMSLSDLPAVIEDTVKTTISAVLIAATANLYGWVVLREGIPMYAAEMISSIATTQVGALFIIIALLIVLGTFMAPIPAILILTPILVPYISSLGINKIHFGIIMILSLMIGLLTPPVGMVLYILQKVSGVPFIRIVKAILPFLIPVIITLIFLVYFPQITLFIPSLYFSQ
jgi:tripartite ATP-independent transporter DctM subunit